MNYRIKDLCKEKRITLSELAEKIDVKTANLSASLSEKGNPTITTLQKIATALNVPFTDLFEQPKQNIITCPHCNGKIKVSKDE